MKIAVSLVFNLLFRVICVLLYVLGGRLESEKAKRDMGASVFCFSTDARETA